MYKDKYTKELANYGDISLVMYVSEDDRGEHTQYVVCRWYDPEKPIGQQWYAGDYFGSNKLVEATEAFKERSGFEIPGRIPRPRLEELATKFKDVIVDELGFSRIDFAEYGDGAYHDLDLSESELDWFGIEDEEDDDDDLMDTDFDEDIDEIDDDDLMDGDLEDVLDRLF